MTPEDALKTADEVLFASTGGRLADIQRLILSESLAGKGYEEMEGYSTQHFKNEGKTLWDLLSKALGVKVSKTDFRGALENRWKSGTFALGAPPNLRIYDAQTWVGRKAIIDELCPKLQENLRLLWIAGISGTGKTTLGECLASKTWESDPSFQWLHLEILEGQSPDFATGAADLLAKMGEPELDLQERNDPKRLTERLLRKLRMNRYWVQIDSLERLLNSEQPTETEFIDGYWVTFLQRCLTEQNFVSRLVLTAQALPSALAEFKNYYPKAWQEVTLQGLSANGQDNEHLELFGKNGVTVDEASSVHLMRIGQIYEGHPLVLQVIAKEILGGDFQGDVAKYWQRYGNEFEQVARELQSEQVNPALYNQALQAQVRRRVEISLKRLPQDAFDLLCRSSVFRRPVPETFWLEMIGDRTPQQQNQAYLLLTERALVEREGIHQNQFLIRQHNLIHNVAYELLKADIPIWQQAESQAAERWLTAYKPTPDAPNLENVRGYLEAFNHYFEIQDWEAARNLPYTQLETGNELHQQLFVWSYFRELVLLHSKLLTIAREADDPLGEGRALRNLGNAYSNLGQYNNEAITCYQKALTISQKIGDRQGEGDALGNLGLVSESLGQYEQAIDFHQQQLKIAQEIGDHQGEGRAFSNLGTIYYRRGRYKEAINYYKQSLIINHILTDQHAKSSILGNLGLAYYGVGQYEQAINYLQQYRSTAREIGNRKGEGSALCNLGLIHYGLGQYEQVLEFQNQYLKIAKEIGDRRGEGRALCNLGTAYTSLGQYEQAIEFQNQSLIIRREVGDRSGEGISLGSLGFAYHNLGEYDQAITYHQQYLAIAREIADRQGESNAQCNLGDAYSKLGQYEQAINCLQQCLVIARENGERRVEGIALVDLGQTFIRLEQYKDALTHIQAALEIFRDIGDRANESAALKNLAELHQALDEVVAARQYCQQAVALATELGIPLAAECQTLMQSLENLEDQ